MDNSRKKIIKVTNNVLRQLVTIFLPVWILGSLILWGFFYSALQTTRQTMETNIEHVLNLQRESVVLDFNAIVSDLKFLSEMVEVSGYYGDPDSSSKERLNQRLVAFLKAKGIYDRVVVVDSSGQEVVSVDAFDGQIRATPEKHLHNRSQDYYFQEAWEMSPHEIYISPFELKVEHGQVQRSYEPVIRLGTLLMDPKGEKKGVLIVNYTGTQLIRNLDKIASNEPGDFMFLNRKGYWLKGRTRDEEWGFMFPEKENKTFRYAFPEEWRRISQERQGAMRTPNGFFSFVTVFPFQGLEIITVDAGDGKEAFLNRRTSDAYYWKLVTYVPPSALGQVVSPVYMRYRLIFLVMTLSLLATFIFLFLAEYYHKRNISLELEKSKMDQILDYGEKVRTITNLNMLIDFIIKQASLILESERCSLMLFDEDTGELCIRGAIGLKPEVIRQSKMSLGEGIAGLVAEEGKSLLVEVIDEDKRIGRKNAPYYRSKSFLSVPIRLDHKLIGVVNVTDKVDKKNPTYTETDLKILLAIVRQAAVAIENAELSKELKYLTITDPLTHLYNYRHLMECLAYELKRFKRFGRKGSLLIIDVDDFKQYNDVYGQGEGNILLSQIGRILTANLREVDILCRYAGDEFVVILPDTGIGEAKKVAEKVRKAIEDNEFKRPMTVSIGVADSAKNMNRHDLILKADAALHQAKKEGKNRVFCQGK